MGSIIVSLLCRFVFVMIELETTQSFGWLDGQFSTLNLKESLMQDYFTRGENILAGSIEGLGSKNDPFLKKNSMKRARPVAYPLFELSVVKFDVPTPEA